MSYVINLNKSDPAAESGRMNGKFQKNPVAAGTDPTSGLPYFDVSCEVPNAGGVSKLTGSAAAAIADCGKLLSWNITAAATYTLPATPPSVPDGSLTNRWKVRLQNAAASTASLTVTATTAAKLNYVTAASITLGPGASCVLFTDGTDYFTGGDAVNIASISIPSTTAGNFTLAHGLGRAPLAVVIEMTAAGAIWFQSSRYDATNLYLVASDDGLTAVAKCF